MKKIRIGNDIRITWTLMNDDRPYPVNVEHMRLFYEVDYRNIEITDYSVSNNIIAFTFLGKDQEFVGRYALKYVEYEGQGGMLTYDTKNAFALVPHSWQIEDPCDDTENVEIETVEITSDIGYDIIPPGFRLILDCGTEAEEYE